MVLSQRVALFVFMVLSSDDGSLGELAKTAPARLGRAKWGNSPKYEPPDDSVANGLRRLFVRLRARRLCAAHPGLFKQRREHFLPLGVGNQRERAGDARRVSVGLASHILTALTAGELGLAVGATLRSWAMRRLQ
jgi:hypothetical protein